MSLAQGRILCSLVLLRAELSSEGSSEQIVSSVLALPLLEVQLPSPKERSNKLVGVRSLF